MKKSTLLKLEMVICGVVEIFLCIVIGCFNGAAIDEFFQATWGKSIANIVIQHRNDK